MVRNTNQDLSCRTSAPLVFGAPKQCSGLGNRRPDILGILGGSCRNIDTQLRVAFDELRSEIAEKPVNPL